MEVVVKHYRIKQYPKYKLAKNILFVWSLVQKELFSLKEHHFICLIFIHFNTFSKPTCQYKKAKKKKKSPQHFKKIFMVFQLTTEPVVHDQPKSKMLSVMLILCCESVTGSFPQFHSMTYKMVCNTPCVSGPSGICLKAFNSTNGSVLSQLMEDGVRGSFFTVSLWFLIKTSSHNKYGAILTPGQ